MIGRVKLDWNLLKASSFLLRVNLVELLLTTYYFEASVYMLIVVFLEDLVGGL